MSPKSVTIGVMGPEEIDESNVKQARRQLWIFLAEATPILRTQFDEITVLTGPETDVLAQMAAEVAGGLGLQASVSPDWRKPNTGFSKACQILVRISDAPDAWCDRQERHHRRTRGHDISFWILR